MQAGSERSHLGFYKVYIGYVGYLGLYGVYRVWGQ